MVTADGGVTIVDLKTGSLSDDDAHDDHNRQIHIYAYIWRSLHGSWPVAGEVRNPTTGANLRIAIDSEEAERIAVEASCAMKAVNEKSATESLAKPGAQCARCDFRPWCDSYWLSDESAGDVSGRIAAIAISEASDEAVANGWLTVETRGGIETLTVRQGPSVLCDLDAGASIRVVNLYRPPDSEARLISGFSEVFVVASAQE